MVKGGEGREGMMREEREEVEKERGRRALLLANSSQTNPNMRRGTDAEVKGGATRKSQDSNLCLIWEKIESMLLDVRKIRKTPNLALSQGL